MCEYCGCRQVTPLAELMDEHLALLDLAGQVRRELVQGRRAQALEVLADVGRLLDRHARREEDGVFTALRDSGDFVDEVDQLTGEHGDFHERIAALTPDSEDLKERVDALLGELSDHIDREDLGIFPVSVVTLGSRGWEQVDAVHAAQPSFLAEAR
ncbi:MAG: hemerythrin domain-containing protein [Marmoricola sp.]